ncbi:hypothetical protein [Salipiger bermudensis]|uniref:Uncharacterized protein n=1 Tax=Salipiger bermudensis (strain DSM 26914 / JCM 13377 / KCTC 12554 / HTCC2601) TaxID=314265 RepID=Q0FLJ7_SALBH|nr:hypothetical protein [Salipiger bermudensis]EAU45101.1 hypothetical protein R2601_22981 [Salipiger bermudensis HTCC2601]
MTATTYQLDLTRSAGDATNIQQAIAIELAIGGSLGSDFAAWPAGLANEWNAAAEAGTFATSRTLGDMARAFLGHRLTRIPIDHAAAPAA